MADDFVGLIRASDRDDVKAKCEGPASEARRLVAVRADLSSSTPLTAATGEQRLDGAGGVWTPEKIDEVADQFAACSTDIDALMYGISAPAQPVA